MTDESLASGDAQRWEAAARLFDELADLSPDDQAARLDSAAECDPVLAAMVRRMVEADRDDADLLGRGLAAAAAVVLELDPQLTPGARIGAFDIVGELGRGGMGVVYEAHDRHLGRPAALKFLPVAGPLDRAGADRLIAEAKAASALDHPNVATVYQVGEAEDGRRFIAMARYEGETLRERLARGRLPVAETLGVARQVAAGLAAAHRAGIVHRDVTPANIFLTRDGTVKLLDFGIAALAGIEEAPGPARGTVSSMSPEQARGDTPDPRTDVWALGMVLFRMLTGEVPFAGETTAATVARIRGPEPAPRLTGRREVPARIARVIDRALQKDPGRRYPDAAAMLAALDDAGAPRRPRRITVAGALLAAGAVAAWMIGAGEPPEAGAVPEPPLLVVPAIAPGNADSAVAALAEAVVDEVTRRLTMLGRVRVVEGRLADTPAAAEPGAHLLEVSLSGDAAAPRFDVAVRSGDPLRVVWAESRAFDPLAVRELSRDLSDGVLRALDVTLSGREYAALAAGFPSTVAAYQDFLAGNQLLKPRTPEHLLAAIASYRRAHEQDSTFVSALARHAYAISLLVDWGWRHPTRSRDELLAEGVALSDRALALDSASAEAWLARAYLMVATDPVRMEGAPEAFRRAIALNPYNAEAYHQYGQTAMQLGMLAEAATAYRRAIELQPDAALSLVSLGGLAELRGARGEAMRLVDSAVAVAPEMAYARAIRSLLRSYAGAHADAREDAAAAIALDTTFRVPGLATMAVAVHGLGDTAAAAVWLARAEQAATNPLAPTVDEAHLIATAQVALGRYDSAVLTVVRARPRGAGLWYLLQHPVFDPLRADPVAGPVLAEADPRTARPRAGAQVSR